jgi:hypothetical protein
MSKGGVWPQPFAMEYAPVGPATTIAHARTIRTGKGRNRIHNSAIPIAIPPVNKKCGTSALKEATSPNINCSPKYPETCLNQKD